jgi:hypothetical protein
VGALIFVVVIVGVVLAVWLGSDWLEKKYGRLQRRYEDAAVRLAFYRGEAAGHIVEGAFGDFYRDLMHEVAYQHAVNLQRLLEAANRAPSWRRWFVVRRANGRYQEALDALARGHASSGLIREYVERVNTSYGDDEVVAWRERLGHGDAKARQD